MDTMADMATRVRALEQRCRNLEAAMRANNAGRDPLAKPPFPLHLGKTDEAIAKGSTGTVSRYIGVSGTETDTTQNDECKNRFADVESGAWVAYAKIDGMFYLLAAECEVA